MSHSAIIKKNAVEWHLTPSGDMRVPGILFGSEKIMQALDAGTLRQVRNVASLPGIIRASMVMPDAHSGYGFPIGGVAAFDPAQGGVVSAGGVGFDIACGVRTLVTNLTLDDVRSQQKKLAKALYAHTPTGVGKGGNIKLSPTQLNAMLTGGATWAVEQGYGAKADLDRCEENGTMQGAKPKNVSQEAKKRFLDQLGTLGSGNHYLEVQHVTVIHDKEAAKAYGIAKGNIVISIHCGSRGLGHQIGTDYLATMAAKAEYFGIRLPEKELACAPIESELGQQYLGAMRAGINTALANRQVLTHLVREALMKIFPTATARLLYDVSHNTCKEERHTVEDKEHTLFVHRKGATRAFGPNHPDLPSFCQNVGQPVIVGGSMGTNSYILAASEGAEKSFYSANHGAGRALSRTQARKRHQGKSVVRDLQEHGITIQSSDMRGIAEEAPAAYKDVDIVIASVHKAGLARPVAQLEPLICCKG